MSSEVLKDLLKYETKLNEDNFNEIGDIIAKVD